MERPQLDTNISLKDFKDFYWLKQELIDFCKKYGINTTGGKIELAERISYFLTTRKVPVILNQRTKSKSNFDWNNEILTTTSYITDNYKNTENVRAFFTNEIGAHFSFNVKFNNFVMVLRKFLRKCISF